MIDINLSRGSYTLKAGDWVTRIGEHTYSMRQGSHYKVYEDSIGLHIIDDDGDSYYSIGVYPDRWELMKERTPTLEESLQEAADAGFAEALGQNKTIKHLPMLLGYLKQHSIIANFNYESGKLECDAVYYDTIKQKRFVEVEEVFPNMKAVREFLGY
jgi:hypothetical protein